MLVYVYAHRDLSLELLGEAVMPTDRPGPCSIYIQ